MPAESFYETLKVRYRASFGVPPTERQIGNRWGQLAQTPTDYGQNIKRHTILRK